MYSGREKERARERESEREERTRGRGLWIYKIIPRNGGNKSLVS